jgi:hypothetical protein
MSEDNVVEFPYHRISNPLADGDNPSVPTRMDLACDILEAAVIVAIEHGYSPKDYEGGTEDYGILLNLVYATLTRAEGEYHFLHEMMDEVSDTLASIKDEYDDRS